MTRPSQNTDKKLIQAALALLPETGYSGMKMREVAKRAGVNLGMFHYYFQSKDEFLEQVATEFYEGFYREFSLEAATGATSQEQLWNAILAIADFGRKNRKLVLALAKDVLENNQQVIRLFERLFPRHGVILIKLVRKCQKEGVIAQMPLPMVMTFLMGSIFGPIVMMSILEHTKLNPKLEVIKRMILPFVLSEHSMEQRMKLSFAAVTQKGEIGKLNSLESKKINTQVDVLLKAVEQGTLSKELTKTQAGRPRRKA